MAKKGGSNGPFSADFVYTDEILSDFERLYLAKKEVRPAVRIVCGVLGVAGALYFGFMLYVDGASVARIGYLIACSLMLLVAFSAGKLQGDTTIQKYRNYYTNRRVEFLIDEDGVKMKLERQKAQAFSKFSQIYGLYESEKCFYFVIKGKAYYIISKQAVTGGTSEDLLAYMQKQCKKQFMRYEIG